ncbi:MAG: 2-oxo acid dehydrogenase subunit E2, partial [Candidatus Marinimicrobia bacterium]|nr:2-oxo acid dehydrogenase subunit E2 [Candidatus Neomarinimicrobiota bacterium]
EVSVAVGEVVAVDETIVVLESDKASMEIPSDVSGTISEILVEAGDELRPGHLLMKIETIETTAEAQATEQKTPPTELKPKTEELVPPEPEATFEIPGYSENVFASPGVRRLARELGINLQIIKGSGQKGRITKDDLNGYIKLQMAISSGSASTPKQEVDFSRWGDVEIQKLTRIKRITGERLQSAWQSIPHVTQFDEADITDIDAYRKKLKTEGIKNGTKVTFLPFLMKAATIVLKERPAFNSSLDHTDQNLVFKNYYHLGIAVDTPNGLTVPVVRDVDKKSIFDLSENLRDLSSRARDKKLKPDEMKGATFTISSLGGIGGTGFSPIVNPPEVAILGVSRSAWKQVFDKEAGEFQARLVMPFSLSYDHRVIDGAAAAAFTSRFAAVLSDLSYFKD